MNIKLSNPSLHELIHDVADYYNILKMEKSFLKDRLVEVENKINELELRYKIKEESCLKS